MIERVIGAISGNKYVIQDLKQSGTLTDAALVFILSALGIIGVFIVNSYLTFINLQNSLPGIFEEYGTDAAMQSIIMQMVGTSSFTEHLAGSLWGIAALIIGLAALLFLSSLLIHLFAIGLKGQARFTNILVFNAFLLPLAILFSFAALFPQLSGLLGLWQLFFVMIILLIILTIILIRTSVIGISAIYSLTKSGAAIVFLLTAMIFVILATIFWMVMI